MEAVAALGVAAAAVQFLTFSLDTLELCRQIRDNADGATARNVELDGQLRTMKDLQQELQSANSKNTSGSRRIVRIGKECEKTADELLSVLKEVQGARSSKRWDVAKATFRAMQGRKTIEKLQNRLREQRELLNSALGIEVLKRVDLTALQHSSQFATFDTSIRQLIVDLTSQQRASSQQHAETQVKVDSGFKDQRDLASKQHADTQAHLRLIRNDTKGIAAELQTSHARVLQDVSAIQDTVLLGFDNLRLTSAEELLLSSLFYPEIEARRETVKPPWHDTFAWVFKDRPQSWVDRSSFSNWLSHGSSIYWINGKAGSGKSTLMAHILHSGELKDGLRAWSPNQPFQVISFFFWRAGTQLQKSIIGLLRSLLYQVCKDVPGVAEALLTELPTPAHRIPLWTEQRLSLLLRNALAKANDTNFCVFIDGLDEFEGQSDELIDLIFGIQAYKNVKCCVSSREELRLTNRLSTCAQMRLQDLNYEGISAFVKERLRERLDPSDYADYGDFLESDIVSKAEGVFLWAALVTEQTIQGADAGDDAETLRERINSTPAEMEGLFSQMLANVDKVHRQSLAFYVQILKWGREVDSNANSPSGYPVSVAVIAALAPDGLMTDYEAFIAKCRKTSKQIVARSKGLIITNLLTHFYSNRVWSISQSEGNAVVPYMLSTKTDRAEIVRTRRLRRPSQLDEEFEQHRHTSVHFVHRSAYDFMFSEDAERILGSSLAADQILTESRLLNAHVNLLVIAPSRNHFFNTRSQLNLIRLVARLHPTLQGAGHKALDEIWEYLQNPHCWDCSQKPECAPNQPDQELATALQGTMERFWSFTNQYQLWNYVHDRVGEISKIAKGRETLARMIRNISVQPTSPYLTPVSRQQLVAALLKAFQEDAEHVASAAVESRTRLCKLANSPMIKGDDCDVSWEVAKNETLNHPGHVVEAIVESWRFWRSFSLDYAGERDSENERKMLEILATIQEYLVKALLPWKVYEPIAGVPRRCKRPNQAISFQEPLRSASASTPLSSPNDVSKLRIVCELPFRSEPYEDESVPYDSRALIYSNEAVIYDLAPPVAAKLLDHLSRESASVSSRIFKGTTEEYLECLQLVRNDIWQDEKHRLDAWQQLYTLARLRIDLRDSWVVPGIDDLDS